MHTGKENLFCFLATTSPPFKPDRLRSEFSRTLSQTFTIHISPSGPSHSPTCCYAFWVPLRDAERFKHPNIAMATRVGGWEQHRVLYRLCVSVEGPIGENPHIFYTSRTWIEAICKCRAKAWLLKTTHSHCAAC